ncbi:MAG TPA: hypothetical protein VF407_03360, partial [Polyangiaceae bacterium]
IAGHGPFDATCKTMPQFILAHLTQPAPPIASRVPGLPRILCEIVDSMLEKDPRKRPQSALECGEALASFDWDFSTTPSAETDKTERDMNTAVASAILGREEKRRREKEIEAERGPVAKPVEWPNGAPAQPAHAQPAGIVSTTLPSPGANDAPPRQRAVAVVEQGSALSRTASTQTAPVAVEVGDLPPNGPRGFGPLAPAAPARRFHVNETAPLPPELDTRGRDPSTFQGLLRTLAGDYGRGKQVRVAAVAIAAASVLGLAATEVFVSARASHASTAARTATSTSLALSSAAPTSPSPSLQASAAPSTLATVDALPAAVPATTVSSSASSPIQPVAAQSAASTAKVTHAASSSTKPTPRPAPSASAAGPVMVDLGDGVKVPMNMDRKLPGSGL